MQDIHSVNGGGGGGAGRLFVGNGDRRLRPHHHGPQALKCPRCESLNTKFCYYNNYNLSQPRHFCKSCRRYWTKGGVLRNVPVGGGCRKTKRSKPKSSNKNPNSDTGERKSSNSQNSSSESSSLTATTTATRTAAAVQVTAAEVLSGFNMPESSTGFFNIPNSSTTPNPSFDPPLDNNIFPEIGTFTSLITSTSAQLPIGFNISGDISPFRLQENQQQQWMDTDDMKVTETGTLGFMDAHTTSSDQFNDLRNKTNDVVGLGTEDWNNGTDQALFDLTGAVDQSYWSQTQWDDDHGHGHGHGHQLHYLP